jgi:hypothetical protein
MATAPKMDREWYLGQVKELGNSLVQEKSVSEGLYISKHLHLKEENCPISITWWEYLSTKLMRWEIAPLKPGSGNR